MQVMRIQGVVFTLDKQLVWVGKNLHTVSSLNTNTDRILSEIGPANGDPTQLVFNQMVNLFEGTIVKNDKQAEPKTQRIY